MAIAWYGSMMCVCEKSSVRERERQTLAAAAHRVRRKKNILFRYMRRRTPATPTPKKTEHPRRRHCQTVYKNLCRIVLYTRARVT